MCYFGNLFYIGKETQTALIELHKLFNKVCVMIVLNRVGKISHAMIHILISISNY